MSLSGRAIAQFYHRCGEKCCGEGKGGCNLFKKTKLNKREGTFGTVDSGVPRGRSCDSAHTEGTNLTNALGTGHAGDRSICVLWGL